MTYDAYGDDGLPPMTKPLVVWPEERRNESVKALRDEFAMAALSAAMSRDDCPSATPLAVAVYRIADAMMEARK